MCSHIYLIFLSISDFLWSILANRTLLWVEQNKDGRFQTGTNDEDCEFALQLAPWIPSYAEWARELGLPSLSDLNAMHSAIRDRSSVEVIEFLSNPSYQDSKADLVVFESQPSTITLRDLETMFSRQLMPDSAKHLFQRGEDYFYGMVFDHTFVFADIIRNQIPRGSKPQSDEFSIAIDAWENDNIANYTACLMNVLSVENPISGCRSFLLTQSESTFLSLRTALSAQNCDIIARNTTQNIEIDFWRNFALASYARTAYVGRKSNLLISRIEYLRQQEIWRRGRNPPLIPELLTCFAGTD